MRDSHGLPCSDDERYTAASIEVLEGLEPVRRRPGMYIGGTDEKAFHHLFSEILDNAVDEVLAGHAGQIGITLNADGSVTVVDDGRGIPVDSHPKFQDKSALEVLMTTLHAGGKFASGIYKTSGGLHGVGVSVVNALSSRMVVKVARNRRSYRQSFSRGHATSPLEAQKENKKWKGTSICFLPDPDVFGTLRFKPQVLFQAARSKAYLCRGLEVHWACAASLLSKTEEIPDKATFRFPGGLQDFLTEELRGRNRVIDDIFAGKTPGVKNGESVEWAISWLSGEQGFSFSYCNAIPTADGGTHETGLRNALLAGLRQYGELIGYKKAASILGEDVIASTASALSVLIEEPEFQGQTKQKLTSRTASRIVEQAVRDPFDHWLTSNPARARTLLDRIIERAEERVRRRLEKDVSRKSATQKLRLPGKLTDCSKQTAKGTEIFIVEGDSAGGSAKLARDRTTQAILPLRGKILNVASAGNERIRANQQIFDLLLALGCGVREDYTENKLRYEKVIIMTDADVDGAHIASLLIAFFFKEMPQLILNGHLYLASPPLYRLTQKGKTIYAHNEEQKEELMHSFFKNSDKVEVGRYKGLGEMTPKQLKETTMDPIKRTLLRIILSEETREASIRCVDQLMGSRVEPRFRFIQERARFAQYDSLDL